MQDFFGNLETFFGNLDTWTFFLESLYIFFAAFTHRWIFLTNGEVAVKQLSETRWSADYEAVKPVFKCYKKFVDAIEELCDTSETIKTRVVVKSLLPAKCDF